MPEAGPVLSVVVSWLLTYAIHSTILIGAVWLAAASLRWMSDSTREVAWKLALTGALLTSAVQVGAGIRSPSGVLELDMGSAPVSAGHEADLQEVASRRHVIVTDAGRYTISVERDPGAAAPAAAAAAPRASAPAWPWIVIGLWVAGALFCLSRLAAGAVRLRRALKGRTQVVDDPVLEGFLTLCQRAEIKRRIRLTRSSKIETPLALWRSEICLPERALRELQPPQIHAVLAHELAHLQRRDPAWATLAAMIEAIFFFQPFNRLARRQMERTAEYLCDDWAVRHTGTGEHLATSLARVAGWRGITVATPLAAGVMRPGRPFAHRVHRLLDSERDRSPSEGGPARTGLVLGVLAGGSWLIPGVASARPAPAQRVEIEPVKAPVETVAPEEDDDDHAAVIVVPDPCRSHCGRTPPPRPHPQMGPFGGSHLHFWGWSGGLVEPEFDMGFEFELRIDVPEPSRARRSRGL